jgi:hypothetical protein
MYAKLTSPTRAGTLVTDGVFVSPAIVFRSSAILHGFYYSIRALFLLHTKRLDLRFAVAESMGVGFTVPPIPVVRQNAGRL